VTVTTDENRFMITAPAQSLQPKRLADGKVSAYFNCASSISNLFVRQTRGIMHEDLEFKGLAINVANGSTLFPSGVTKSMLDALFVSYFFGD
jgi:hypothetical protein